MVSFGHTMATAITSAPSAPTSIPKAKAFVGNVGDKVLWGFAILLAIGVVRMAAPYAGRVPVLGSLLAQGNPAAAFDRFGTAGSA